MMLVVNAGSSSIKVELFDDDLASRLEGQVSGIGGAARLEMGAAAEDEAAPDHAAALDLILAALARRGHPAESLTAAGHRVVHGGTELTQPCRITPSVLDLIEASVPLAPLHNPHNLAAIRALADRAPDLPQYASFDTAFHATMAQPAYALPPRYADEGYRRYGFHGLSYASVVARYADITGQALPKRLLACHLGNGASLCAIVEGRSLATTMGYSPVEGLVMGTRAGDVDANLVLDLAAREGVEATRHLLNSKSGLLGLSGESGDMRALLASDGDGARAAVDAFCHRLTAKAGEMIALMEGVDAIVLTGGIGEHAAPVRARFLQSLGWLGFELDEEANSESRTALHTVFSDLPAWVFPADEERQIARDVTTLMNAR